MNTIDLTKIPSNSLAFLIKKMANNVLTYPEHLDYWLDRLDELKTEALRRKSEVIPL